MLTLIANLLPSPQPLLTIMTNDAPVVERSFKILWMWILVGVMWFLVIVGGILWWKLPSWAPDFVLANVPIPDLVMRTAIEGQAANGDVEDSLVQLGPRSIPTARSYLHHEEKKYQLISIGVIETLKTTDCYDDLIVLLNDSDEEVAIAAIIALGNIGDSRAIQPLIDLMDKDDKYLRARSAIIKLPHALVVDACKPYLDQDKNLSLDILAEMVDMRVPAWLDKEMRLKQVKPKKKDEFMMWQETAAYALACNKSPNARSFIIAALSDPDPIIRKRILRGIAYNFQVISDLELDKLIVLNLSHENSEVVSNAAMASNLREISEAVPLLLELMNSPDAEKRKIGTYGFGVKLIDPRATQRLIQLINDRDEDVRFAAISTIGRIAHKVRRGDQSLLEPLLHALKDPKSSNKKYALLFLSRYEKSLRINEAVIPLLNDSNPEIAEDAFRLIDVEILTTQQKITYDEYLKNKENQE